MPCCSTPDGKGRWRAQLCGSRPMRRPASGLAKPLARRSIRATSRGVQTQTGSWPWRLGHRRCKNPFEDPDLASRGLVPAVALGVASGVRAIRQARKKLAYRIGDAASRSVDHQSPGFRCRDDLGVSPDVGRDNRRSASHGFQEYIRPTLAARRQHERIRRCVVFLQTLVRNLAYKAYSLAETKSIDLPREQ